MSDNPLHAKALQVASDIRAGVTLAFNPNPQTIAYEDYIQQKNYTDNLYQQYLAILDERDAALRKVEEVGRDNLISGLYVGLTLGSFLMGALFVILVIILA